MPSWKRTFYAAWVAQICSIAGFSFVLPFLPLYIRELGVPEEAVPRWAGIAAAGAAVSMAIFSPLWGIVADRYGRKPMVLRSMLGGTAVLFLMSYCQSVGQLIVCRVLQGILTGTITASLALVTSVAPRERSGYVLGMMAAAVSVGVAIGPFLGGEIAELWGLRAAFRVAAALLLVGAALVHFGIREQFTPVRLAAGERRGGFGEVLGAAGFAAATFALFVVRFGESAPGPVFPLFVQYIKGSPEGIYSLTGRIFALGGLASAISAGVLGRVSDAWGHRRLLVASSIVAAALAVGHVFATEVWHLYALRFAIGLAAAGMTPAANAIIRHVTRDQNLGKAYGVTSAVSSLGWAFGPLAGGFLHDLVLGGVGQSAGLRAPFLLMGFVLAFTAGLVAWGVRRDPAPGRQPTPGCADTPSTL